MLRDMSPELVGMETYLKYLHVAHKFYEFQR